MDKLKMKKVTQVLILFWASASLPHTSNADPNKDAMIWDESTLKSSQIDVRYNAKMGSVRLGPTSTFMYPEISLALARLNQYIQRIRSNKAMEKINNEELMKLSEQTSKALRLLQLLYIQIHTPIRLKSDSTTITMMVDVPKTIKGKQSEQQYWVPESNISNIKVPVRLKKDCSYKMDTELKLTGNGKVETPFMTILESCGSKKTVWKFNSLSFSDFFEKDKGQKITVNPAAN